MTLSLCWAADERQKVWVGFFLGGGFEGCVFVCVLLIGVEVDSDRAKDR